MPRLSDGKDTGYLPRTAHIMPRLSDGKDTGYLPRTAHIMPRLSDGKDTGYLPRTARIMSHIGVKIPSARINTITATIPIRIGSIRAVRLLRS